MNQRTIVTWIVFAFFILSIASTIVLTWKVNGVILSGETVGNVSLIINNPCGNNVCGADENCPVDAGFCTDNKCYEPTCTNGCGEELVANGSTDEACTGSTGCAGGNCECDGAGTCVAGEAVPGGGAGGGGGGHSGGGGVPTEPKGIDVLEDRIKDVVKVNELLKQRLTVRNLGGKSVQVNVEVIGLEEIIRVLNPVFLLGAKDTQTIVFDILSEIPGVYTGQIIVKTQDQSISIPVVIEVETKQVLFDLSLDVKPKTVLPGEEITGHATLFNINEIGLVNVDVGYFIKDLENNLILEDSEVISIETQATLSKTFTLPEDIAFGEYVFIVQASYQGTVGTSSESFQVGRIEEPGARIPWWFILIILIILLLIGLFVLKTHKKISKVAKIQRRKLDKLRIDKRNIIGRTLRRQKILKKKEALEKAYRSGYIKREAFEEGVRELDGEMRKR